MQDFHFHLFSCFVDGSGRTGWHEKSKPVVGGVILHDKLKYWTSRDSSIHYHQGLCS